MTEMTAEILIAYADANGLEIMSHRNPNKWADTLNKNGGMCPCGKQCPCDNCTCLFYITNSKHEDKEEMEIVEFKLPELARAVETLEKVKNDIMAMPTDNMEKAIETMKNAEKEVTEDAEKHKCEKCAEYMESLARKIAFLKTECKIDGVSCGVESRLTVQRINEMQETFIAVDKEISEQSREENGIDETKEDNNQETQKNNESPLQAKGDTSNFHACITETTIGELQDIDHGKRICTASKMCGTKKLSKEEAIKQCIGDKK